MKYVYDHVSHFLIYGAMSRAQGKFIIIKGKNHRGPLTRTAFFHSETVKAVLPIFYL